MKKKTLSILFIGGVIACLGGCYEPAKVSDHEMDLIAEYAAGVLVDHGTDSKEVLLTREEQTEEFQRLATPTPRPTLKPTDRPETTKSPVTPTKTPGGVTPEASNDREEIKKNLTELFDKDGFSFGYIDYVMTDLYQGENDLFAAAAAGKQLLVVRLEITNNANETGELKLNQGAEKNFVFTLRADTSSYRPSLTLLNEDIYTAYSCLFKAGETKKGVVVFEIKKDELPENISMSVLKKADGKEDAVLLKIK